MPSMIRRAFAVGTILCVLIGLGMSAAAVVSTADDKSEAGKGGINAAKVDESRQQAIDFLRTTQSDDGSWTSPTAPGITGLVTMAILKSGLPPTDPLAEKALKHLATFVQDD